MLGVLGWGKWKLRELEGVMVNSCLVCFGELGMVREMFGREIMKGFGFFGIWLSGVWLGKGRNVLWFSNMGGNGVMCRMIGFDVVC